jgi:hypothetical protein
MTWAVAPQQRLFIRWASFKDLPTLQRSYKMKPTYKVIEAETGSYIERTDEDGKVWSIPMVEGNSDYQAYLADEAKTK